MDLSLGSSIISCRVTPLYNVVGPKDNLIPWDSFSFEILTKFNNASYQDTFLVERCMLLDDQESSLHDILLEMHVPLNEDETLVDKMVDIARRMATSDHLKDRRVLYLRIEINVGLNVSIDDHDEDYDDYDVYQDDNLVPVSDFSIKNLEEVHVGMDLQQQPSCMVCLQEFLIGSKETCLPCKHLFHDQCIREWLRRSGVCPLCRFRIS